MPQPTLPRNSWIPTTPRTIEIIIDESRNYIVDENNTKICSILDKLENAWVETPVLD